MRVIARYEATQHLLSSLSATVGKRIGAGYTRSWEFDRICAIFLLMMFIAEKDGYSSLALHYYGGTFLFGRLLHGICFGFMNESFLLRVVGTVLTLSPILGLSTILIIRYFGL